jgi:fucose 4-O-acetylase-like acetyltransferase
MSSLQRFMVGDQNWVEFSRKDQSIETLRGIAIIFLVIFHAREFTDSVAYRFINSLLDPIRMPLFASISGYLYACRPIGNYPAMRFLIGKARRILLPCFTLLSCWIILKFLLHFITLYRLQLQPAGFGLSELLHFYLFRPRTYWFLQAIFLTFCFAVALDKLNALSRFKYWVIAAAVSFAACMLVFRHEAHMSALDFFSFNGAMFLTPFFLLGLGIKRFGPILLRGHLPWLYAALLVGSLSATALVFDGAVAARTEKYSDPFRLIAGISGILLLYYFRKPLPVVPLIGFYAFAIYILHRFCFDLLSITALLAQKNSSVSLFSSINVAFYIIIGIILPIIIQRILQRNRLTRLVFFGTK